MIGETLADRLGRREIGLVAFDKANRPIAPDLTRLCAERDALSRGIDRPPVAVLYAVMVRAQWGAR